MKKLNQKLNLNNALKLHCKNVSYYFLCNYTDNGKTSDMDDYEREFGYEVCYVDIDKAISENIKVINSGPTWVKREIEVLQYIKEYFKL